MYRKLSEEEKTTIETWIRNHPRGNFWGFKQDHPKTKLSHGCFVYKKSLVEGIKNRNTTPPMKKRILDFVKLKPDGISRKELEQEFNLSTKSVYWTIHNINKKEKKIESIKNKYYFIKTKK